MQAVDIGKVQQYSCIEHGHIFMAPIDGLGVIYGVKAKIQHNNNATDPIVCIGPRTTYSEDVFLHLIEPKRLRDRPVINTHNNVKLDVPYEAESTAILPDHSPDHGNIIYDGNLNLMLKKFHGDEKQPYLNLSTGDITRGPTPDNGYIFKKWSLKTTDPCFPRELISFDQ